ncbi:MAG TPA: TIGR03752 family integrating conjugative element protein [Burkholderiaceae bacterium]
MKANPLLKWLLIPMVLVVVFVGLRLAAGGRARQASKADATARLTPGEMKAVGIDGDTPRDTVATLVAEVRQLRNELHAAVDDNRSQHDENERLRAREGSIDQRIQSALDGERGRVQQDREQAASDHQQAESLLQDLQHRLDGLSGKAGKGAHGRDDASDLPVGLGLEDGDGKAFAAGGGQGGDGARWIEPEDARPPGQGGATGAPADAASAPATSFGPEPKTDDAPQDVTARGAAAGTSAAASVRPVYTLPANSTLMGAVAMTALIGRVPIDGTVDDPYPFKVLIGRANLTANGVELPDVAGAVVSGTASGDWTLSCVRGQVRSVTFVFRDGTIRTLPDDDGHGQTGAGRGGGSTEGGLGWISDPYGVPCVSGEQRSNVRQYLGSQALITAAGAGAAALIRPGSGDQAVVSNNGALGTVGIGGNAAMGRILAGGVHEAAGWVDKLYGQAFAAIYVPPDARVAVHLARALRIDYDPKGRRVDHRLEEAHAPDLD